MHIYPRVGNPSHPVYLTKGCARFLYHLSKCKVSEVLDEHDLLCDLLHLLDETFLEHVPVCACVTWTVLCRCLCVCVCVKVHILQLGFGDKISATLAQKH